MPQFSSGMTPNWTGSTPKALATSRKIGVQMMISGAMSMKAPRISRMTLISSRIRMGLSVRVCSRLTIVTGASL